ncbi:hypothetical protein MKX01_001232 [Papaver californicum]|nr:hypothetical protein MKX01_001232 [Papaver californicum]
MDSPSSGTSKSTHWLTTSSPSFVESSRSVCLSAISRIDKEDLRKRILIPEYLRFAIKDVFDLSAVKPPSYVQYGLGCLEKLVSLGDECAKEVREKMRIVVAGGDGTVGWVLRSLSELNKQKREPDPPTRTIPLGTSNDLSRSFGWLRNLMWWKFEVHFLSRGSRTSRDLSTSPTFRLDRQAFSYCYHTDEK